jgi:hypothetical protein
MSEKNIVLFESLPQCLSPLHELSMKRLMSLLHSLTNLSSINDKKSISISTVEFFFEFSKKI